MRTIRLLGCMAAAALALSCLGGCSSGSSEVVDAPTASVTVHSTKLEGAWCLEASTVSGSQSLAFRSVCDEANTLVVEGDTATLTLNGESRSLEVRDLDQSEEQTTATFATADELTKMHAVVTMTEGEDRDSIVLTSAYDTNVILVGIRRDDSLPPEKVRIDATWDQFAANL